MVLKITERKTVTSEKRTKSNFIPVSSEWSSSKEVKVKEIRELKEYYSNLTAKRLKKLIPNMF